MLPKRTSHLKTVNIWCFGCFLYVHAKFHNVQKKLQQILVLRITPLNGKR